MVIRNSLYGKKRNERVTVEWRDGMLEAEAVYKFALKMKQRTINRLMSLNDLHRINICFKEVLRKYHSSYSFFFPTGYISECLQLVCLVT